MGLTKNQLGLIKAVAEENLEKAKLYAIACCAEDTTQKNKHEVNRYQNTLKSHVSELIELPANISMFATLEDLKTGYNENRYFLSESEKQVFEQISNMYTVSLKLMEKQIHYLNATLLYGESGVGKTAFAKYIAYKLELPYLYVNLAQMLDSYLGGTAKNLTALFQFVQKQKCVLMLDEIDALAIKRRYADSGAAAEVSRSTTCLLQLLDRISNNHVILAATNLEDSIDTAVKRRFTQKHEIKRLSHIDNFNLINQIMTDTEIPFNADSARKYADQNLTQSEITDHISQRIAYMLINQEKEVFF